MNLKYQYLLYNALLCFQENLWFLSIYFIIITCICLCLVCACVCAHALPIVSMWMLTFAVSSSHVALCGFKVTNSVCQAHVASNFPCEAILLTPFLFLIKKKFAFFIQFSLTWIFYTFRYNIMVVIPWIIF